MHLSMLSRWGGRPGKGGGFELRSSFQFKCPTQGELTMVKRVQIFRPRDISVWSDIWNVSYIELQIWNQVSYDLRSYDAGDTGARL